MRPWACYKIPFREITSDLALPLGVRLNGTMAWCHVVRIWKYPRRLDFHWVLVDATGTGHV